MLIPLYDLFLESSEYPYKVLKVTTTKNWKVWDFKNPPKDQIVGWRTLKIKKKDTGEPRIIKLALVKDPETGKIKTRMTSFWRPKK